MEDKRIIQAKEVVAPVTPETPKVRSPQVNATSRFSGMAQTMLKAASTPVQGVKWSEKEGVADSTTPHALRPPSATAYQDSVKRLRQMPV